MEEDCSSLDSNCLTDDESDDSDLLDKNIIKANKEIENFKNLNTELENFKKINIIYKSIEIGGTEGITNLKEYINKYKSLNLNDTKDFYWTTPLGYACFLKEEEIAIFLIDNGADVNLIDSLGNISLNYAVSKFQYIKEASYCKRENREMMKLIIKMLLNNVNIFHLNKSTNQFPLHEALINNFIRSHNLLSNRIASIEKNIENIEFSDDYEKFSKFIKYANESESDLIKRFFKLLDIITKNDEDQAIEYFDKNKDVINCIDCFGQNALFFATSNKMKSLMKKLINNGIDYERSSSKNINIIDVAGSLKDNDETLFYLLDLINKKLNIDDKSTYDFVKDKINKRDKKIVRVIEDYNLDPVKNSSILNNKKITLKNNIENKSNEDESKEDEIIKNKIIQCEKIQEEILEEERINNEKIINKKLKKKKLKNNKLEKQKAKLEKEKLDKERVEQEKLKFDQEMIEKKKLEQQRLELEKLKLEKLEQEKLEQERLNQELIKKKSLEAKSEKKRLKKLLKHKELSKLNNFFHESERLSSFWDGSCLPIDSY